MDGRDLFDLLLVAFVALLGYVKTFGFADPAASLDDILSLFSEVDMRVYMVLGGVFGIIFVGYIAIYLPKKAAREGTQ
ncbi:MAG: hypothetical protein ABEJ89_07240 [Haloarculaceae archaeon]